MASHSEIAKRFGERVPNKRHGNRVVWTGSRVWCEDEVIYSYGSHFPMAKFLGEQPKKGRLFIKNSDKYSSSTSAHQSCVRASCPGPSVSRSRLSKFIDFTDLKMEHIHLWRPGAYKHLWHDTETGQYYDDADYRTLDPSDPNPTSPFMSLDDPPDVDDPKKAFKVVNLQRHVYVFEDKNKVKLSKSGSFKAYRYRNKKENSKRFQQGMFTITEVLVLKVKSKYLLCMEDEVHELPREPKTISEAIKLRKHKGKRELCKT